MLHYACTMLHYGYLKLHIVISPLTDVAGEENVGGDDEEITAKIQGRLQKQL